MLVVDIPSGYIMLQVNNSDKLIYPIYILEWCEIADFVILNYENFNITKNIVQLLLDTLQP